MNHYLARVDESLQLTCRLSFVYSTKEARKIILTSFVVLSLCVSTTSRYFTVQNEITRRYRRFNAEGRELTVRLTSPPPARDPARYFSSSMDELFEYSLRDLEPGDMVEISIHNANNQQDRPIGLILRRRDQISREV